MYSLYLNYFKFVSLINLNETDTPRVFMGALNPFDKKKAYFKMYRNYDIYFPHKKNPISRNEYP